MGGCCAGSSKATPSSTVPQSSNKGRAKGSGYESDSLNDTSVSQSESERNERSQEINEKERLKREWKKAVQSSNNRKLKLLVKNHHKKVNFKRVIFDNGDNSLHYAIRSGNHNLTKFLLLIKMPVNLQNRKNGNTALHYAVQQNDPKMVTLLYTAKQQTCKTDIMNNESKTAQDIADQQTNGQMCKLLAVLQAGGNANGKNGKADALTDGLLGDSSIVSNPSGMSGLDQDSYLGGHLGSGSRSHNGFGMGTDTSLNSRDGRDPSRDHSRDHSSDRDSSRDSVVMPGEALSANLKDGKSIIMSGFMDKKRRKSPHIWQRRWVMLNNHCILWSDKELTVDSQESDKQLKDQFAGFVDITNIIRVTNKESKNIQNKFVIKCRDVKHKKKTNDKELEYMFRCEDAKERKEWVDNLNDLLAIN